MEQSGLASYEQIQSWNYNSTLPENACQEYLYFEIDLQEPEIPCLYESIDSLFDQEPSLRTVLYCRDQIVFQKIRGTGQNYAQRLVLIDITGHCDQKKAIGEISRQVGLRIKLDDKDAYCKYLLIRTSASTYKFIFFIHHIICDAWSINLIKTKLLTLYEDRLFKRASDFKKNDFNLIDYADWQRKKVEPKKDKLSSYWHQKLAEPLSDDHIDFVSNFARIAYPEPLSANWHKDKAGFLDVLKSSSAKAFLWELDVREVNSLRSICRRYKVSSMSVFYSLFMLIPWLHDERRPTLIASPVSYRFTPQTRDLIGHLVGGLYNYTFIDPNEGLKDFIQKNYIELLKAIKAIIYDHAVLNINVLNLRRHCDVFLNMISKDFQLEPDLPRLGIHENRPAGCYYALNCAIIETETSVYLDWEYKEALYKDGQIEYFTRSLGRLIEYFNSQEDKPLSEMQDLFKVSSLT